VERVPSGADRGASGVDRSARVSLLFPKTKGTQRGWLWFGEGPEVDFSRCHLTHIDETMLNLP